MPNFSNLSHSPAFPLHPPSDQESAQHERTQANVVPDTTLPELSQHALAKPASPVRHSESTTSPTSIRSSITPSSPNPNSPAKPSIDRTKLQLIAALKMIFAASHWINAAEYGDTETIKRLISVADVNIQNRNGETALMLMARSGNGTMVQTLLSHGAKVDIQSDNGRNALMFAASRGQTSTIKPLLKAILSTSPGK